MISPSIKIMGPQTSKSAEEHNPGVATKKLKIAAIALFVSFSFIFSATGFTQDATAPVVSPVPSAHFRIGERLTYSVSLQNIKNVAYFETFVVSPGKLAGKDVIEIRGRLKTFELVSAALNLIDETRTVYADPESGLPVYMERTLNDGAIPKEITNNYLVNPTSNFDLLTVLYKVREGSGSFPLFENGESSTVAVTSGKPEKVRTFAGEFSTTSVSLSGAFFDARGMRSVTINLSADDKRLPVLIRFKTDRGDYRAELTGIQETAPATAVDPAPTPTPAVIQTPRPISTPKPQPTATPYIANLPLLPELSFALGETLEYKVSTAGVPVATLTLTAKERTLFRKRDSLTLSATITGVEQGNHTFALGDSIIARVDPDQLLPIQNEMRFGGALTTLNQTATFDPATGTIVFGATNPVEAPIGTHSLLSLLYAMRSFNLRPSKDRNNPVNDTRVAVFWKDKPYIFTLRPVDIDSIAIDGQRVSAQLVTVISGVPELDQLGLKVWLSTDEHRVPLRISIGKFQADLSSASRVLPN